MSYVFKERAAPSEWPEFKRRAPHKILTPFYAVSWLADWAAYFLAKWPVVELLEYLGSFSILFAAIVYFAGAPDRLKQKHYQAWQVINTAQGKGGSGGRIEALQELNADHVALVGVDVSGAFLQGIRLSGAKLLRSNFSATDSRGADFRHADFTDANLSSANFRESNFYKAWLQGAQVNDADLFGADLTEANLAGANLANADLRDANLSNIRWREIANLKMANINGVKNAPEGFVSWALKNGAVTTEPSPE